MPTRYLLLTSLKVGDWSGHIFGASASPRPLTKNLLWHPLPLIMAVSMISNMWHSSCYCMRHSWLTKFGVLCLNQLVFDRWCGFQVIDPTVAWILSRVGPTIRRGYRLVSYCTTVVVCIPRLLAAVVSLIRCLVHQYWLTPS